MAIAKGLLTPLRSLCQSFVLVPNCCSGPRLIRRNTYRWMNLSAAALCGSCRGLRIRKFFLTDHQELQTGLILCMTVPYVMC